MSTTKVIGVSLKDRITSKIMRAGWREKVHKVHEELIKYFADGGFEIKDEKKMSSQDNKSSFTIYVELGDGSFIENHIVITGLPYAEEDEELLPLEEFMDVTNLSTSERALYECLKEDGWRVGFTPVFDDDAKIDYMPLWLSVEKVYSFPKGKVIAYIRTEAYTYKKHI